ncbi:MULTISPECIES: hypothetical protein [unclassified Ensifer]|uniref:hypothetical protein n=1 Tax=unclassified Ensifer TaxID=2633371 RepID=UPI003F91E7FC
MQERGEVHIGSVFQSLPSHVATGVIKLVLDDNEVARLVEREKIQSLARLVETVKLFLDDE